MTARPRPSARWQQLLASEVSPHYRSAGRFACHFASSKIRHDPLFTDFFRAGLGAHLGIEPAKDRIDLLDLGCGQGLLALALAVAHRMPPSCAAGKSIQPFGIHSYLGIECSAANVARAQSAFASVNPQHRRFDCLAGNIVEAAFPPAKVVALIDVLHYLGYEQQEQVLRRVRAALPDRGALLLRVGDAEAGRSNGVSQQIDRAISRWRGTGGHPLHCRGLSQWLALLHALDFAPRVVSRASSMFYANVLIVAERP